MLLKLYICIKVVRTEIRRESTGETIMVAGRSEILRIRSDRPWDGRTWFAFFRSRTAQSTGETIMVAIRDPSDQIG